MAEDELKHYYAPDDDSDDEIPDVFCCSITCELMDEPVMLIEDSQTYEQKALNEWFSTGRMTSPLTGITHVYILYFSTYTL